MPPPSAPVFDRERADFLRDVQLFIDYEASRKEGTPIAFEVAFGRRHSSEEEDPLAQDDPVSIAVDSRRKIRLNGRIDRIDRIKPSVYDVIDYKTGGYWKANWKGTFARGTRLQHALYALAALELLKREDPAASIRNGVYLFPSAKAGRQRVEIASPDRKTTGRVIGDLLDVMAGGAFVHTCTEDACTFCDFGNACGKNAPARANAKFANASEKRLQAVRRLAGHE
jgi:ATP-dependent helicase/nuclease subunit B